MANVYLAVLYYVTGQYQTAIDHCKLVTRSQDHSQCSSHVVQGELLPKIDNDIDNVLGLSVFYQYVRTAALNQQGSKMTPYGSAFSPELFAHCVHTKCLLLNYRTVRHTPSPATEVERYRKRFHECSDMFITDVLVFSLMSGTQCTSYDRRRSLTRDHTKPVMSCQLDTSELVELLQQSAVEHLTKFRQFEARYFGCLGEIVTTDFEALYAYKCGEYQRCLQLSTHNIHTLLVDHKVLSCTCLDPEFIQLMDNNIASLSGLTLIVNMSSRKDGKHLIITQPSLLLYLMSQCQMKLHHSATALAQTLHHVEVARRHRRLFTLDQLLLKLTERELLKHLVGTASFIFV